MRFVYHDDYVCPLPPGHRFPMPKFALLRDHLLASGLAADDDFAAPAMPVDDAVLRRVHEPAFVRDFTRGDLDRDAVRRIGLPWSAALVNRTKTAVAGTLLTCELALDHGLAANCAGGTHHAHAGFGSGFCIFNDAAVAAADLLARGRIDQALIVDLDVHQGDGTARLFADDPRVFTFSMHCGRNFPLRKAASDLDVALPEGAGDDDYLRWLRHGVSPANDGDGDDDVVITGPSGDIATFPGISELIERVEPDLVVYDAGVDPHRDDRLGRLRLTDDGLYRRDRLVIDAARAHGVPVACVIGGGYDHDHARIARRHATVHRAAADHRREHAGTAKPATAEPAR